MIIATNVRKIIAWAKDHVRPTLQGQKPRTRRRELSRGWTQAVSNGPPADVNVA